MCCCRLFLLLLFCNHSAFLAQNLHRVVPRQYQLQQSKSTTSCACSHACLCQTTAYFRLQLCASSIEMQ